MRAACVLMPANAQGAVIHQCAELGEYYQKKEAVEDGSLAQFARDPGAKFGKLVLLLQFSENGFRDVIIKGYNAADRLRYLYREGPPNKWDATPTSGMPSWKPAKPNDFEAKVGTRLVRLGNSIRSALDATFEGLPIWERPALSVVSQTLLDDSKRVGIIDVLKQRHPDPKERAFLSVVWVPQGGHEAYVGDFGAFQRQLKRLADEGRSRTGASKGGVGGIGECAICGKSKLEVTEPPPIYWPPLYSRDKPGSISGGFHEALAWQNCPTCRSCYERIDFARERIKKNLSFNYYGFKYLVLPAAVAPKSSEFFDFLDRLDGARINVASSKKLISAEDDLAFILAEEKNRLQFDLLFFKSDPQSFRPALYIAGMVPSRFRELFNAKDEVEKHPWCRPPSPKPFHSEPFTFKELYDALCPGHKGANFEDDFLVATRAALEKRVPPYARMLAVGMRWISEDSLAGRYRQSRIASLFRSLLFFERLRTLEGTVETMTVDYGNSQQAERVRQALREASGALGRDPAAQAAFLIGACCGRIEDIQYHERGSTPFSSKLKGFRLNERDTRNLFRDAKEKAAAYGYEHERKVTGLLTCAASALLAAPDGWALSPDEISYYVALGHALRSRLARDTGDTDDVAMA